MKVKIETENMKFNHEPLEKGAEVEVPASVGQIWIETKRASRVGGAAPKKESVAPKGKGKKSPQKTADKKASQENQSSTPTQDNENSTPEQGAGENTGSSDSENSQENS